MNQEEYEKGKHEMKWRKRRRRSDVLYWEEQLPTGDGPVQGEQYLNEGEVLSLFIHLNKNRIIYSFK